MKYLRVKGHNGPDSQMVQPKINSCVCVFMYIFNIERESQRGKISITS